MLAVAIILLAFLSAISLNQKRRIQFLEYLNKKLPSADTDEDVIGVLEASGAEIAPRLLEAAEHLDPNAEWRHDVDEPTPLVAQWECLLDDLTLESNDDHRLHVLNNWLERGYAVTVCESVMIVKYFDTPDARATARALITKSMQEKAA